MPDITDFFINQSKLFLVLRTGRISRPLSFLCYDKPMRFLSYLLSLIIPISVYINLTMGPEFSFLAIIVAFGMIPTLDSLLPFQGNTEAELKNSAVLDSILYLNAFIHFYFVYLFCIHFSSSEIWWAQLGKILALGLSCGTIGINIAHELGHRKEKFHRGSAMVLLSTSLYTQFYIEHNKGHHRHVATPQDPASARLGENVYTFILRSMWGTLVGAYRLDRKMFFIGMAMHASLIALIFSLTNTYVTMAFIAAAFVGGVHLEVVNYIEHYGLSRKINPSGRFEKVTPHHSWNSNHFLGRKVLFELTRHSDHHAYAARPFYNLRTYEDAPNLPAGYPAMMLLSLVPPLFFKVMDPKVKELA